MNSLLRVRYLVYDRLQLKHYRIFRPQPGVTTDRPSHISLADKLHLPYDTTCDDSMNVDCAVKSDTVMTSPTLRRIFATTTVAFSMLTASTANISVDGGGLMSAASTGFSSSLLVGCLGATACVLLLIAVLAVYRYRRCYDGTYEIDAESSANGYVPTSSTNVSNGELRPMYQRGVGMNGSVRTKNGPNESHYTRPTRELYV